MALLKVETRKKYFKALGLGEYNAENIKKLQKKYLRKQDVDGVYGIDTDRLLRHVYNVRFYSKNFKPEEFKCECGGKYCTGYPSYMKRVELANLQSIRDHYKRPMTVTCGLRCAPYNRSLAGSIQNSKHLTGYACDFYMKGVTDTLANRRNAIRWIKKLPNHGYTYGDGYNSNGVYIRAAYMGNALHTDTNKGKVVKQPTKADKILIACKAQANWMKNYRYSWESNPTIAKSKRKGTCVTYVACVLQRLGYLKSGQYIWHDSKGRVTHANSKMSVMYPNRKIKSCRSILKAGDVIIAGNKNDVAAGSHIFIFSGKWSDGDPIIWDNHSCERVKRGKSGAHTYDGNKQVIAVIRMKG
jgi:hypothetical protein